MKKLTLRELEQKIVQDLEEIVKTSCNIVFPKNTLFNYYKNFDCIDNNEKINLLKKYF